MEILRKKKNRKKLYEFFFIYIDGGEACGKINTARSRDRLIRIIIFYNILILNAKYAYLPRQVIYYRRTLKLIYGVTL